MKSTLITGLMCTVLVALAACGPLNQNNAKLGVVRDVTAGLIAAGAGAEAEQEEPATEQALTREFIDAQGGELMRMSVISREATALVVLGGRNGGKETWFSSDGLSVSLENGLLIGTRGFGDDLMGADITAAQESLNEGGSHIRTFDFLNGLGQIERLSLQCTTVQARRDQLTILERTFDTAVLEETCEGAGHNIKNTYWQGHSGVIWQSRQWVSEGVGYIGYQRY